MIGGEGTGIEMGRGMAIGGVGLRRIGAEVRVEITAIRSRVTCHTENYCSVWHIR